MFVVHAFLLLTLAIGWAASEPEYTQSLARARSMQEVERLHGAHERLKIAQTACQIELSERRAPVSCYEAVDLETLGKSSLKVSRLARLDSLCARAANALRLSEPTSHISKSCARSLREAHAIQRYRDEEDSAWSSY